MGDKYSKYTLPDLTVEYFEFEKKINDLNFEKNKIDEQISELYNDRCDVYNLIKKKQEEKPNLLNREYILTLSDLKNAK
jgi:hypothetical protein